MKLDTIVEGLMSAGPGQPKEALIRQWELDHTINTFDRLPSIKAPTHIIWGAQDKIIPEHLQHDLVDNISGAKFTRIETSGHCPPLEVPADFARIVLDDLLSQ